MLKRSKNGKNTRKMSDLIVVDKAVKSDIPRRFSNIMDKQSGSSKDSVIAENMSDSLKLTEIEQKILVMKIRQRIILKKNRWCFQKYISKEGGYYEK